MTTTQYINLSLQIWGCVLTAIIIISLNLSKSTDRKKRRIYTLFLLFNAGVMFFDAFALYFRGGDTLIDFYGVRISNCLGFSCGALVPTIFLHYMAINFKNPEKISPLPLRISQISCVVYLACYGINLFFPLFYRIDAENIYHRMPLYPLTFIPVFLNVGLAFYLLFRYKNQMARTNRILYILYFILPIPVFVVQMFIYGLNLVNFTGMIFIVVFFLFIEAEQEKRMAMQETEVLLSRVDIALSQIQPHFLYNSLTSIYRLCDVKPEAAKEAVSNFSKYLRGNLDSIKNTKMITFAEELEHIKAYLALEKIRYDEYLEIVYDTTVTGFFVPPLTVQPLVENAVNHGISNLPQGGCITISSQETEEAYEVRVSDNGIGFDQDILPQDGRSHIGISSVRIRLETMCLGTLEIQSRKNIGTTAIIRIPK